MIKLTEDLTEYDLSFFEDDIFFQRIYSDFLTIGKFPKSFFYICVDDNEITAVISKICGVITLSAKENADFEEINEFVRVIGFSTILCDFSFSCHFDGKKTSGKIMKIRTDEKFGSNAEILRTDELKEAYPILKRVFRKVPDFPDWFVNTCYGVIHNSVIVSGVHYNQKLVSVAFALFVTERTAVISAVATHPEHRNRGYAMEILKKLLDENTGKEIYIFLENPLIEEYYGKLGFVPCKMWSEIENVL